MTKALRKYLPLLAFGLISCSKLITQSPKSCPVHLPYGIPQGTPKSNHFIARDIYCLSSNNQTKFADYVAYHLDPSNLIDTGIKQERNWQADPNIDPKDTLEPEDYRGAYRSNGYDRGHLAPLASFRGKNWQEVNYLSNIAPQKSDLNRGPWADLENRERDLTQQYQTVYVIVGTSDDPNYNSPPLPNADEPHQVPDNFWKILMYDGKLEAYLMSQNMNSQTPYQSTQLSLTELEKSTKLNFDFLRSHYTDTYHN